MTTTSQLRLWWAPACQGPFTTVTLYGGGRVSVRSGITQAVGALNKCLEAANYKTRVADTGAYNCRPITGGTSYSLHAYGIAVDLNWQSNPYGSRLITDMPAPMVAAIKGIRTKNGKQVWRWGGDYAGNKDAMHYEIICSPADIATGINQATFPGAPPPPPAPTPPEEDDMPQLLVKGDTTAEWWITDGITKDHVEDKEHAAQLAYTGLVKWNNGGPFNVPQAMVNKIPLATVGDQIVWYVGKDGQGSHAYRVWGNIGKYLATTADVNLLKFLGVREANPNTKPLGKEWSANVVLVDGPSQNA